VAPLGGRQSKAHRVAAAENHCRHHGGMGRKKTYSLDGGVPLWATPAGVCDTCGWFAFALHQVGKACFHCICFIDAKIASVSYVWEARSGWG